MASQIKEVLATTKLYFVLLTYDLLIGAYGEVRKCLNKQSKALRAVKIINKLTMAE